MSARKRQLIVRPDAQDDVREILLYTFVRWNAEQRRRYRRELNGSLRSLLAYPELGPTRDDLFAGCRNLTVKEHLVFYTITDDAISVLRALHGSQNAAGKVHP